MMRPPFTQDVAHGEREITITFLTHERFSADSQIGLCITQEWHSLLRALTWPTFADDKRAGGAWSPCALPGGRVDDGRGPVSLLVGDVDTCTEGAIDSEADALGALAGAIIPSFSATREHPKNRIIVLLSRALWPDEFPIAWRKFQTGLGDAGIVLDPSCKNINRLWFMPVAPRPEAWLGARLLTGVPLDVDAMMVAAIADIEAERARRPPPRPVAERNRDRYVAAAIDRARANVGRSQAGERHGVLLREAFSLARFGLTESQITDALLEPFVAVAGEGRRREGERGIRDAVNARQGAA